MTPALDTSQSGSTDATVDDGTVVATTEVNVNVSRTAYNLNNFNKTFEVVSPEKDGSCGNKAMRHIKPHLSCRSAKRLLWSLFPILEWLPNYDIKSDLAMDIIVGITIAIFHVPQSMGYALIAGVPVVYGLYSAFYPALIYSVMGTSKHCAVGTFAVVSLMTGTIISQTLSEFKDPDIKAQDIAIALAFLIGCYQLLFGILQLGFVSVYLSDRLVSGFTTAAAFYVFTSQIGYLLGIHLSYRSGPLALFYAYIELVNNIYKANVATVVISVTCIATLLLFKLVVNPKLQAKFHFSNFPIELVLVILGTVLSSVFDVKGVYDVHITGRIESGLPPAAAPRWDLMGRLAVKCIPLAVVAYSLTISVGKIFAVKHNYAIDSNQELLALGATNTIASFFSCIPSAASLSRSAIQENTGGRTQVVSLVNCLGLLCVLLFFGKHLETLPVCVLAATITVALKTLLGQVCEFFRYWRVSKLDGAVWLVTFSAVIVLDVDYGLYVGLVFSLLTLIYKSQRPKMYLLGSVADVFVPLKKYASAKEIDNIMVYQFCGPLHFANTEYFKTGLSRKTGFSVSDVMSYRRKTARGTAKCDSIMPLTRCRTDTMCSCNYDVANLPSHIIIDCSMFSYIDTAGVSTLKTTIQEYESIGIKTYLAATATHVNKMLEKDGFYDQVPEQHVFITITDAVNVATHNQRQQSVDEDSQESTSNSDAKEPEAEATDSPETNE